MPKFKIQHVTTYTYEVPVRDSANQIMLYPVNDERQEVLHHHLEITGNPLVEIHTDIFNNKAGTFTHSHPHNELVINSVLEVETRAVELPESTLDAAESWAELEQRKREFPYIDFVRTESFESVEELRSAMKNIYDRHHGPLICAQQFCEFVYKNFTYKKGITTVDTTLEEIWKLRSGVCQDFAHILLEMLRLVNIPARYVSGYICPNKNGMRGEGATHAWAEAFIPGYGWLGLDPTNNCIANEKHVRLAVGKNYYDCSPVRGTYRGTSKHSLNVGVSVSYENGSNSVAEEPVQVTLVPSEPVNSFRRFQEMQMQQQQ
jgi:transglutaminase-like putative cysteine protease